MTRPLPQTLGDLGDDWRLAFYCATCGHLASPAFYYLRKRLGEASKLVEVLHKLRCELCSANGREGDCSIVVEPEWLNGRDQFWDHRYQLARGRTWTPFKRGSTAAGERP